MRSRFWRMLAIVAGVLLVLLIGATYWLFYNNGPAPTSAYRLNLAEVRKAAASLPGSLPSRIEVEVVSHDEVPHIAMTAGTDWSKVDLIRTSYRVVYPDGSVIIDVAHDEADARSFGFDRFDRGAYARVLRALGQASAIVVTHEHGDHLAGALESPNLALLLPRLILTREQLASPQAPPWPAGTPKPKPLIYATLHVIRPGVVLIKAPGHTPGSQMIYVQRADGREFLFMGDVSSMADNVRLLRQRSRYVTSVLGNSDRAPVADELLAIRQAAQRDPDLVLVPGHDAAAIDALVRRKLLVPGFRL